MDFYLFIFFIYLYLMTIDELNSTIFIFCSTLQFLFLLPLSYLHNSLFLIYIYFLLHFCLFSSAPRSILKLIRSFTFPLCTSFFACLSSSLSFTLLYRRMSLLSLFRARVHAHVFRPSVFPFLAVEGPLSGLFWLAATNEKRGLRAGPQ